MLQSTCIGKRENKGTCINYHCFHARGRRRSERGAQSRRRIVPGIGSRAGGWVRTAYVYEKNTCMVFRYKRRSFTAPPRTTATPPAHGRSAGGHRHGPQPIDPVFVGYSTSEVLERENTHAAHVLTRTRRNRAPGVATWASLLGALFGLYTTLSLTQHPIQAEGAGRAGPRVPSCLESSSTSMVRPERTLESVERPRVRAPRSPFAGVERSRSTVRKRKINNNRISCGSSQR